MATPVIYELDSIGTNGELEAVGTHPFCSASCRDAHTGKILGPIRVGEIDNDFSGLLCEECGARLGKTFDRYLRFRHLSNQLSEDGAFVILRAEGVLKTYVEENHENTFTNLLYPLDGDLLEIEYPARYGYFLFGPKGDGKWKYTQKSV